MSWIKLETHLSEKPEIYELSEILKINNYEVIGKCFQVWAWFDLHTIDGKTKSIMRGAIDKVCEHEGFSQAMTYVGWLDESNGFISIPNCDRHNSQSAKDRSLTSKRVTKSRKKYLIDGELRIPNEEF